MKNLLIVCSLVLSIAGFSQSVKGFEIIEKGGERKIDVLYNGKLLTAYRYDDSIRKPFLFPLNTVDGITVTRGWPLEPRAGERTDHPHHTGLWMNYESVNGLDFWNNSTAIEPAKRNLYGTIRHEALISKKADGNTATLVTSANWLHSNGHVLVKEQTTFLFSVKDNQFFIERTAALTAGKEDVVFKDVKDGFLAIRVARELEMPSTQEDVFTDIHGNKTSVPKSANNEGVTGMYTTSEGVKGDAAWSTKGRWATLQGKKEGRDITIGIIDHPANVGYPAYWHARGYGLFALNPLGKKVFSNGKEELNFTMKPGTSVTLKYKIVVASGKTFGDKEMNTVADEFAKK